MVYLFIGKNSIKLLTLSKTLLGQYNVSHFEKKHTTDLLEDGKVKDVDLLASAIKEALTSSTPQPVSDRDVTLILPQASFDFARYNIPKDISPTAVTAFIRDKVRTDTQFDFDHSLFDYLIKHKTRDSTVFVYAQKKEIHTDFQKVCKLLQLNLESLLPDTLCYYTLFEKTLRADKKEHILYVFLDGTSSFAYVFDYLGPQKAKRLKFDESDAQGLKKIVQDLKEEGVTLNRLILSGKSSKKIRQDLFTKDVGVWTNPLHKIIQNFYQQHTKTLLPNKESTLSLVHYDVCLGAFIFVQEQKEFSILKNSKKLIEKKGFAFPRVALKLPAINKKWALFFLASFMLSFIIIFAGFQLKKASLPDLGKLASFTKPEATPTPTPEPTKKPTPTPGLTREDVNIMILNGSGIKGKAGEVADILKEVGYVEILTDNADSFDFTATEIQIKDDKKELLDVLIKDLEDFTKIKKKNITSLDEDDPADIIITIGTDFE
ncbi:MAG: LytR C-terminal domain-containing protein [Candidatus Paceibacterota bacterium]